MKLMVMDFSLLSCAGFSLTVIMHLSCNKQNELPFVCV